MKRTLVALGGVAILALGLWACSGGGQQQQQVTPPAEKQATVDQMNQKIASIQSTVDSLKSNADKLGAEAKAKLTKDLEQVQPGLDDLKNRVMHLTQAADEVQWQQMKAATESSLKSIEERINKVKAELGLGAMPGMPAAPAMPAAPKAS